MKFNTTYCCRILAMSVVVATALGLQGCASSGAEGTRDTIRFPNPQDSYLETGDFIDPANVRRISAGQDKDQVRLLLGNPHFSEGLFGVDTWNYVFNFYTDESHTDYVTCQYRVDFDDDRKVAATYWRQSQCADLVRPAPMAESQAPEKKRITLPADLLFEFDSAALTREGRQSLNDLVADLRSEREDARLRITGYADRLGSREYNRRLSTRRAESVKSYLVSQDMAAANIRTEGRGEDNPVKSCPGSRGAPGLKACLQPNRRVTVDVGG